MKKLLLTIILFSSQAFGVVVKIPAALEGVMEDKKALRGEFYEYDISGKIDSAPVQPRKIEKPASVDDVIASLIYAYNTNDQILFKSLFTEDGIRGLSKLSQDKFDQVFASFADIKEPVLEFYFKHGDGYVARWKETGTKRNELVYVVNKGGWKLHPFHATAEDFRFLNVSYYFTYRPFDYTKAEVVKNINPGTNDFTLELKVKSPLINFMKLENGKWDQKIVIRDNGTEDSIVKDSDPRKGFVKVVFEKQNFTPNKSHEILVIESTYPVSYVPAGFAKDGQIKVTIK